MDGNGSLWSNRVTGGGIGLVGLLLPVVMGESELDGASDEAIGEVAAWYAEITLTAVGLSEHK